MNPTQPSTIDCCPTGLSAVIEGNQRQGTPQNLLPNGSVPLYHDDVHITMSGVMGAPLSPATPAFWVWHANVDQIWKDWEDNCSNSTLPDYDLFMKDHPYIVMSERDLGDEPSIYNSHQYLSYDIWCRNQNDGLTNDTHQDPINDGINSTHVYVRVRNRGKYSSQGTEELKIYWSKASTNLTWPQHWNGSLTIPHPSGIGTVPMGNIITTLTIPQINPMDQEILHFTWMPPNPSDYSSFNNQQDHFCLLARIDAPTIDPMFNEVSTGTWNLGANVKNNNNIIWKNLSVIDLNPSFNDPSNPNAPSNTSNFYIGNSSESAEVFDLLFENIFRRSGNYITDDAEVSVQLNDETWNIWEESGNLSEGLKIVDSENHRVKILSNNAKIKGISMPAGFVGQISVQINFLEEAFPFEAEYDYNVRQILENTDSTLGGVGIKIYPPTRSGIIANAGLDHKISAGDSVELRAFDIGEGAKYKWYDENSQLLHKGLSFYVSPLVDQEYRLAVISDLDGIKDYDKVKVTHRISQIVNISPNPASDIVNVEYELENVQSATILLIRPYGGSTSHPLNLNHNNISIDLSAFQPGLYYISLICDGLNVDSKTLIRN